MVITLTRILSLSVSLFSTLVQGLQQFLKIPLKPSRNCVETKPNTEAKPPQNYREKKKIKPTIKGSANPL